MHRSLFITSNTSAIRIGPQQVQSPESMLPLKPAVTTKSQSQPLRIIVTTIITIINSIDVFNNKARESNPNILSSAAKDVVSLHVQ